MSRHSRGGGNLGVLVVVGFFLFFTSCKVAPLGPPLVHTIAILPFDSESNNVDAPDIMQRLVYLAMVNSQYSVLDIKETNAKLEEVGIVDGGQLGAIDFTKLGKDLGVQGLIVGNVESFGYTNIGVYVSRKVRLELSMIEVSTGETLWENAQTGATRKFGFDKETIKENFAKGLADQLTDKVFKTPLAKEAKYATKMTLRTLPGFRFSGFARDDQTPSAGKSGVKDAVKSYIENK